MDKRTIEEVCRDAKANGRTYGEEVGNALTETMRKKTKKKKAERRMQNANFAWR